MMMMTRAKLLGVLMAASVLLVPSWTLSWIMPTRLPTSVLFGPTAMAAESNVSATQFTDVDKASPTFMALQTLVDKYGIVDTLANPSQFRPNATVTRGEFIQFYYHLLDALNDKYPYNGEGKKQARVLHIFSIDPENSGVSSAVDIQNVTLSEPYGEALVGLIDAYGVVLLNKNKTFAASTQLSQRDVAKIVKSSLDFDGLPKNSKPMSRGELAVQLVKTLDYFDQRAQAMGQ